MTLQLLWVNPVKVEQVLKNHNTTGYAQEELINLDKTKEKKLLTNYPTYNIYIQCPMYQMTWFFM